MQLTVLSAFIALTGVIGSVRALPHSATTPCIQNCLDQTATLIFPVCYLDETRECYHWRRSEKIQVQQPENTISCVRQKCTAQELIMVQEIVTDEGAARPSSSSAAVPAHSEAPHPSLSPSPSTLHASSFERRTSKQKSATDTAEANT